MRKISDKYFNFFEAAIDDYSLPQRFTFPFQYHPHPLCILAAQELQRHLCHQRDWQHNFGLVDGAQGKIVGKMFGVLIVKNAQDELGYLAAFSGKLAGGNHHSRFVPPVFDGLTEGSFVNEGMTELTLICKSIVDLVESNAPDRLKQSEILKKKRGRHSAALQERIFDQYAFLNQAGQSLSLRSIFKARAYRNPPGGAGECAAPKLLQYAFEQKMHPIAMAEFWWGLSPKTEQWKHGAFYPACSEKCGPILAHMLEGIELELPLVSDALVY